MEEKIQIEHLNLRDQQQKTHHNSHQQEWEIRMEEKEFKEWKRKENKYILFFDGASKGNPGVAGEGGMLVGPNELP
jgi:hypothetical protein